MATPNFFRFAKSELTQDAFILWLLEWANPNLEYIRSNSKLHEAAQSFVRLLLLPDGSKENLQISSVEYEAQKNNIDVLALIKDVKGKQYAVIIEDKTDTTIHDNQLVRYSQDVKERYNEYELHCVYFKTGNESKQSLNKIEHDYKNNEWVKTHNPIFKMVLREDILEVLETHSVVNLIYNDFVENLDRIRRWTASYKSKEKIVNEWGNTAWQGFYMELEDVLKMGTWCCSQGKPVINKKGNSISAWEFTLPMLPIVKDESIQIYLHLELRKLSIKAKYITTKLSRIQMKNIKAKIKEQLAEFIQENNLIIEDISNGKDVTLFNIKRLVDGSKKQFIGLNYYYTELSYVVPLLSKLHMLLSLIATTLKEMHNF